MDYRRYHSLSCERQDKVLIVSLNRPEALNAINADLHTELSHVFAEALVGFQGRGLAEVVQSHCCHPFLLEAFIFQRP